MGSESWKSNIVSDGTNPDRLNAINVRRATANLAPIELDLSLQCGISYNVPVLPCILDGRLYDLVNLLVYAKGSLRFPSFNYPHLAETDANVVHIMSAYDIAQSIRARLTAEEQALNNIENQSPAQRVLALWDIRRALDLYLYVIASLVAALKAIRSIRSTGLPGGPWQSLGQLTTSLLSTTDGSEAPPPGVVAPSYVGSAIAFGRRILIAAGLVSQQKPRGEENGIPY